MQYRQIRFRKKSDADNKIPHIKGLVKKIYYNAKTTEIESKIPSITGLATNTYLYDAFDCMFFSCDVWISEWIHNP